MHHLIRHGLLPLLAAAAGASLQAQPVLSGKDLNEDNLVNALMPAVAAPAGPATAADDGEGEVHTRSIRVLRDQPSAQVASRPVARKPSASLLITFITNSAELTTEAKASLDMVARALQNDRLAKLRFAVEGHADPRGTNTENLQLSQARADSVVDYLVTQHHLDRERLRPVGKGDSEPMNRVRLDAPENRRVTIVSLPN